MIDTSFFTVQIKGQEPFIKSAVKSDYDLAKELIAEYPEATIQHITIIDDGITKLVESAKWMVLFHESMDGMAEDARKLETENNNVLKKIKIDFGKKIFDSLRRCIEESEGVREHCKLEIVKKPKGQQQPENYGIIKFVYVDQWQNGGMEGDSFAGEVYAPLPDGTYLKIPYSM